MTTGSLTDALRETLAVFAAEPTGTPLTTTEVAEALDIGRRSSYDRLDRLAALGQLQTKSVGARGRVWWNSTEADRPVGDSTDVEEAFRSFVAAVDEYAIFLLDAEGYVTTWNQGAERIKGYDRDEIVGRHLSTFYTEEDIADGLPDRLLADAAAHGSVETEGWRLRRDGTRFWASVTLTARYDDGELVGYTKVTRDQTERRAFEHLLRHQRDELRAELDEVFDRVSDGVFRLDDDGQFTYVNEQAAELLGYDRGELEGVVLGDLPDVSTTFADLQGYDGETERTFEAYYEPLDSWFEVIAYPRGQGVSVYVTHISELKQRQRALERYETIVETISDGVYVVDDTTGRFTMVNEAYAEMTGYTREELVGGHVSMVVDDEIVEAAQRVREELAAGERGTARLVTDLQTADGDAVTSEATFTLLPDDGTGATERIGVVRDVSDRVRRERELEQYETIVETVDDGIYIVDSDYEFQLVNEAYERFVGRSREELLGEHISTVVDEETVELGRKLRSELERGDGSGGEVELQMPGADGELRTVEIRYSTLETDGELVGTTGIIRDITDRKTYEDELERQRRQLSALDDLNTVAREVTATVINQSTRDQIERTLCTHLAESDSYDGAWVGSVDGAVSLGAGYEAVVTRATERQEMQVVSDGVHALPREIVEDGFEPLDDYTAAIIPIAHDGTVYGLLHVYAARDGAFTGGERAVLSQLGSVVGHALTAVEQKRALMSDEVVELEFSTSDFQRAFDFEYRGDGRLSLTQTVPVDDDTYLLYGTATGDCEDILTALTDSLPHWDGFDVLEAAGDTVRVQVRLSEPPALAAVAAHGGSVEEFVFDATEAYMRVHVGPGAPVRELVDLVGDLYPSTTLVSRRQVARPTDDSPHVHRVVSESLTDRQRTAIEVAHNSGFFESPRLSSGEDIAETIGITSSTFHQHLRKAEAKIVDAVLTTATD